VIAKAIQVAQRHADLAGGGKKTRGIRRKAILAEQKLGWIKPNEGYQLLKILRHLDEVRKWRAGLTDTQKVRWASPQSVLNRAPCFRPDGHIRGPASLRPRPMSLREALHLPAAELATLLHMRCPAKAHALRHALNELLDGAPRPKSGWALDRERAAAARSVASSASVGSAAA
jgi:hypothetical protein